MDGGIFTAPAHKVRLWKRSGQRTAQAIPSSPPDRFPDLMHAVEIERLQETLHIIE